MSAKYWKNRWIAALVHNGIDPKTAESAYTMAYQTQPADYSKSPEIQALMHFSQTAGNATKKHTPQHATH